MFYLVIILYLFVYLDITFSGRPDVKTIVTVEAMLSERTSIIFQVDNYDFFVRADLTANNAPYYMAGFSLKPYIFR